MKKVIEVWYPYVFSLIIIVLIAKCKSCLYKSENMNAALEAVITVSSLIIGFLGAILPIIMSMKNDSKLVKYVFEKDKDKLFLKYIKHTLIVGILVIVLAVTMYFRDQYINTWYERWGLPILAYALSCFLLCTYRCLSNMLNLIFTNDMELQKSRDSFTQKSSRELKFEENCTIVNITSDKIKSDIKYDNDK